MNITHREPDSPLRESLKLGGFEVEGGRLDRRGPVDRYRRPVRLQFDDKGNFRYWYIDPNAPIGVVSSGRTSRLRSRTVRTATSRYVKRDAEHLAEFIDLNLGSPNAVAGYVQRCGVFAICSHGLPLTHVSGLAALCQPLCDDDSIDGGFEPIAAWRFFQQQAIGLLSACNQLRNGQRLGRESWEPLFDEDGPRLAYNRFVSFGDEGDKVEVTVPLDLRTGRRLERPPILSWVLNEDQWDADVSETDLFAQRWCAGLVIQSWLEIGRPAMSAAWSGLTPTVWVGASSLFGMLAMQIAFAASGNLSFVICHECQAIFHPSRRGKPGQRSYCEGCQKTGVPRRDASRAHRERERARKQADR